MNLFIGTFNIILVLFVSVSLLVSFIFLLIFLLQQIILFNKRKDKLFYSLLIFSSFICGFGYNIFQENSSFLRALGGGTAAVLFLLVVIASIYSLFYLAESYTNGKKKEIT